MLKEKEFRFSGWGNSDRKGGIGIFLAKKWVENVSDIERVSDSVAPVD